MNLLLTIKDSDLGMSTQTPATYQKREASRAVIFDQDQNIALLFVSKKGYHKLPGGGMEPGETVRSALEREVMEETGCKMTDVQELGIVEEFRDQHAVHQLSYCFTAQLFGQKGQPHFDPGEITDGFTKPIWIPINTAIEILEKENNVTDYQGKFINLRDLTLLKTARK